MVWHSAASDDEVPVLEISELWSYAFIAITPWSGLTWSSSTS